MHKKLLASLLLVVIGINLMIWPARTQAATGLVYLSPSSASVQSGSSQTLALRINPGTAIDGVQATITYDSSMVQETAVDTASSDFGSVLQKSISTGTIVLALGSLGGTISSDALVANVTFKALANGGGTSIQLSNVNASYSGSYTNPGSSGANLSFTAVPSTPAPAAASSTGATTKKATTTTTSSTPATPATSTPSQAVATPKAVATVNLASVQYSLAKVTVTTNIPVQAALQYGTSKTKLDQSTVFTGLSTTNSISLNPSQLIPGTTYYYDVITKDAAGNITTSTVKSFKTKGYTFKVTVLDGHYHPVAGKTVTLHSSPTQAKTNSAGVATFNDVAPGLHNVTYQLAKKSYNHDVYVENNVSTNGTVQTAVVQSAAVVLTSLSQQSNQTLKTVLLVLIIMIILAVLCLLIITTPLWKIIKDKLNMLRQVVPHVPGPIIRPSSPR